MNAPALSEQALMQVLSQVRDPHTQKDYISSKALRHLRIDGADIAFEVELGYPARSHIAALKQPLEAAVRTLPGVGRVDIQMHSRIVGHAVQRGIKLMDGVRNVIAVASGKGGVGKSTTAVNLALALAAEGARVGLLDADIYGPSQPTMTGTSGKPETLDGKLMEPKLKHGLQVNSIGFLVGDDQAMVWRGPMASQALEQLITQTRWQDLDYLIVDMPPGTGDIQLTLAQKVPLTGAVKMRKKASRCSKRWEFPSWAWWRTCPCMSAAPAVMSSTSSVPTVAARWPSSTVSTGSARCRFPLTSVCKPIAVTRPWSRHRKAKRLSSTTISRTNWR